MNRETRVQKYAKLREDIDNMDATILENIQKKKIDVVKESLKHGSKLNSEKKYNSTNLSIDEILEGHSKYVDLENYHINHINKEKAKPKTKLFVLLGVVFVVVITLVIIALSRR